MDVVCSWLYVAIAEIRRCDVGKLEALEWGYRISFGLGSGAAERSDRELYSVVVDGHWFDGTSFPGRCWACIICVSMSRACAWITSSKRSMERRNQSHVSENKGKLHAILHRSYVT